jgi:hypothetical protein
MPVLLKNEAGEIEVFLKRNLQNSFFEYVIKIWKRGLYKVKFLKVWNFERIQEWRDFKARRICTLCFSRITCSTDIANLNALEKQRQSISEDIILRVICIKCQRKLQETPLATILEDYMGVQPIIALFCFLTYLAMLCAPNDNTGAYCATFTEKFNLFFYSVSRIQARYCHNCPEHLQNHNLCKYNGETGRLFIPTIFC